MTGQKLPIYRNNNPALFDISAITQQDDVDVIDLTEVFGGGAVTVVEQHQIEILTLYDAITFILEGKISGFEIGGEINGRWSPVGRIRKWGTELGVCQIKKVDSLGREGSGWYDDIRSVTSQSLLRKLVDLAIINPDGKLQCYLKEKGEVPLSPGECEPKFKAI